MYSCEIFRVSDFRSFLRRWRWDYFFLSGVNIVIVGCNEKEVFVSYKDNSYDFEDLKRHLSRFRE